MEMRTRNLSLSAAILCILVSLCIHTPAQSEQLLLEQPFSKGISGWEPFLGYWRLNDQQWHWLADGGNPDGCLAHEAGLGGKDPARGAHDALIIRRTVQVWKDYSFEADVHFERGTAGLWFRARMRESTAKDGRWVAGYLFMVNAPRKTARLWRHRQDGFDKSGRWVPSHFSNPIELKTADTPEIPADRRVRLKVTAVGQHIECFIDGKKIIEVDDGTYSYGSVGFSAYKANARFDNVKVTAIPPLRALDQPETHGAAHAPSDPGS